MNSTMWPGMPPVDDTMWPGYWWADAWTKVRAHKPPDWPGDRPCWCGARRHRRALAPSTRRKWWRRSRTPHGVETTPMHRDSATSGGGRAPGLATTGAQPDANNGGSDAAS